jgi:peptidoglycan/LPS O-acetylase OafA/YrhL
VQLQALTSLRFFAALYVVLFHLWVEGLLPGGPWWFENFASIGYVGVNCFFVLSGFILVYTHGRPGMKLDAPRFWQARFARIYPAYLLSLLVSAPFFFMALRQLDIPFFAWSKQHLTTATLLTFSLLQAWAPQGALTWNPVCWSLSVEAFFYLLFPLLVLRSARLAPHQLGVGIAGCSLVSLSLSLAYVLLHPDGIDKVSSGETTLLWKNVLSFNPLVRLPEFVTGMLAGQLFLARKGDAARGGDAVLALPLVAAGLLVLAILTALVGTIPSPLISAAFLSPAFAAIIYGLALKPGWAGFLEARWLVLLGEASYSLYLLHSVVMGKVVGSTPGLPQGLRVGAAVAAAIVASLLCFYLVEQPARRLLRPRKVVLT